MADETRNVVIIGSGPAGLTAAIYAARANLEPLVIAGDAPGGQLMITTDVENYPGFPDGIMGPELMEQFREQAERFGTEMRRRRRRRRSTSRSGRSRSGSSDERVPAPTSVIIATGASAIWLGLDVREAAARARRLACATCDGFFFRDKEVVVVGGGDTAMEEATFLTRFATRSPASTAATSSAPPRSCRTARSSNPKIEFLWDTVVERGARARRSVTGARR